VKFTKNRATKIVATLGSASNTAEKLAGLIDAGVNVMRLNFSHGTQSEHGAQIAAIRALQTEGNAPSCILADLQGPKHRLGAIEAGTIVKAGDIVTFDQDSAPGNASRFGLPHPEIFAAIIPGARVLMDDGKLVFQVTDLEDDSFKAKVMVGGPVKSRKGVNLPDVVLDTKPLTPKDIDDLEFALEHGVDWVALSFVQRASDVIDARTIIGKRAGLMAKIEKPAALDDLDDIIAAADGIMVARGDLGVELPPEAVPGWQKKIIARCRMVGKPVVVATQMLESMIESPSPTRAEASDVAGAVFDGADAVMLSAETAVGAYPIEAASMMARIIQAAEDHIRQNPEAALPQLPVEPSIYHAVARAAVALADTVGARAIIAFSTSGNTAVRIARERPEIPLLMMTPNLAVQRRLALLWGTSSAPSKFTDDFESAIAEAVDTVKTHNIAGRGDHIVVIAGMPFGIAGTTNSMRVVSL
jgi:pyruvate kinase